MGLSKLASTNKRTPYRVAKCVGLDLEHNCSFKNDILTHRINWAVPNTGDLPVLNRKIIKGRRVSVVEHPYVVSIRRQMAHYLTGTIIGGNLVATVAHPLVDVPIVELGVVTGQNYNDRGSVMYTVILVIFHQNFDRSTLNADLALIRVHEIFDYKVTVKVVKNIYGSDFKIEHGVSAFVTGWGRCDLTGNELCLPRSSLHYRDEYSDPMLRSITIDIQEPTLHCNFYEKHEVRVSANTLCVGPARQVKHTSPCLAVPGAPLVVDGRLLGILSWGFGCGYHTDLPLIYTDVRAYRSWMVDYIEKFTDMDESIFKQLFETTKIAIIAEWISATKGKTMDHEHPDTEIQPWKIDKELAMLDGDLYDIRDYYGGKDYHEDKIRKYELIRMSLLSNPRLRLSSRQPLNDHTHMSYDKLFRLKNYTDLESDYDVDYDALEGNPYTNPVEMLARKYTTPATTADQDNF